MTIQLNCRTETLLGSIQVSGLLYAEEDEFQPYEGWINNGELLIRSFNPYGDVISRRTAQYSSGRYTFSGKYTYENGLIENLVLKELTEEQREALDNQDINHETKSPRDQFTDFFPRASLRVAWNAHDSYYALKGINYHYDSHGRLSSTVYDFRCSISFNKD